MLQFIVGITIGFALGAGAIMYGLWYLGQKEQEESFGEIKIRGKE